MKVKLQQLLVLAGLLICFIPFSFGKPITYVIDPDHTFPTFEADHMGGLSLWRGRINSTTGEIILDKKNKTGFVKVIMDMNSLDFGHDGMNKHAKSGDMFDIEKFPESVYEGTLVNFQDGAPTKVEGERSFADVNSSVVVHRIKVHFGKRGLYETTLARKGKTDDTEVYESALLDEYDVSDAPYLAEYIKTVPVYERNVNVGITLKSSHPAPATLRGMSWEGDFTPKYYKRV